jgi:ribosomal protein S27AE
MIIEMKMDAARYAADRRQCGVRAPENCPRCGQARSMEAHGYYQRWVSDATGEPARICVRRFFVGIAP